MSHEFESGFSARELMWHGLGTVTPDVLTAEEAMIIAELDWEVTAQPVFAFMPQYEELYIEIPGKKVMVRESDGSIYEIVSDRYVPIQNAKAFEFFDQLVDNGDAKYETAGSLKGGRVVFMTAKVDREILIGGVDPVDLYLVLTTSHDGSMALTAMKTPVRVVCKNTLNLALSGHQAQWKLKHEGADLHGKIAIARETIGLTMAYADEFEAQMNKLIDQDYTKVQFEQLVRDVFPHKLDQPFSPEQYGMIGTFESSPTMDDSFRYTAWGALNAVREYDDWGRTIRASKDRSEAELRTEAAWFGKNVSRSNDTFKYLVTT